MNHDSLILHRNLASQFSAKLGLSDYSAVMGFRSLVTEILKLQIDLDRFEDEYQKGPQGNLSDLSPNDSSYDLLILILLQDKSFPLKYVDKTFEFFSDTLGVTSEHFSSYCTSSDKLYRAIFPNELVSTEYEKLFAFFYSMFIYSKSEKTLSVSEIRFLRGFAEYLGLELSNSNLWIGFREFEDRSTANLLSALQTPKEKASFLGIMALVMGGTKDFDPSEKKLLQKYYNDLKLTTADLHYLRTKKEFHFLDLLQEVSEEHFPLVLIAIVEAVFADGKVDKGESEIIDLIARKNGSFQILPCHLLKLYYEVIANAGNFRPTEAAYLQNVCRIFNQAEPDESVRAQLFFLIETYYNLKSGKDLLLSELESCLKALLFSEDRIPDIVDECRKNIKGTQNQIQTLAYVESIHCLKNSDFADTSSLILLLKKVISTTPLNKMKTLHITLSYILSDNKLNVFDNQLVEDLAHELNLHREDMKPIIFLLSLAAGEKAGNRIKFKGE